MEVMQYTRERVIEIIKQVSKNERNLATIGHILRDDYLILNVRDYGIRIGTYVKYNIDYQLYTHMKNIVKLSNHVKKNHKDTHARVQLSEKVRTIKGLICSKKKSRQVPPSFVWSLETNERLVGRYRG